ncbi:MAG: guanylate kinase [Eubacterium sp.]|nr:guanylate kinase [Eubacterium sp.]
MGKLFVFMGKSAAGKDTLFQAVMKENEQLKTVVSYTTRPIRSGEQEGVEYHFVSEERLHELEKEGKVVECRCYETVHGPWYYFTVDDGQIDFATGDYCMISTLEGYEKIRDYYGAGQVSPVYIEIDDFTRIERSLAREKNQQTPCVSEVCRRFLADEQDFRESELTRLGITERVDNTCLEDAMAQIRQMLGDSVDLIS